MRPEVACGIDLGASPAWWVRRHAAIGSDAVRDEAVVALPIDDLLAGAAPLLVPEAEGDLTFPGHNNWRALEAWARDAGRAARPRISVHDWIGVAYPRSAPPALRQVLPAVLGLDAVPPKGSPPPGSPLLGIEAPAALLLEAVARGRIVAPASLAVGTGPESAREWTAATVRHDGRVLRIHLGRTADDPAALGLPRFVGEEADVARGAARYALWRDRPWMPTPPERKGNAALLPGPLAITTEVLHPLGVVARQGADRWVWRRLFAAGAAIPTGRVPLLARSKGDESDGLDFAECLAPDLRDAQWLSRRRWAEAGLRWWSFHAHAWPRGRFRLEIDLRESRLSLGPDAPPPRWGLPVWSVDAADGAPEPPGGPG